MTDIFVTEQSSNELMTKVCNSTHSILIVDKWDIIIILFCVWNLVY